MRRIFSTECSYCPLEGPDTFGVYDPHLNPSCPVHGEEAPHGLEALIRAGNWIDAPFHFTCGLVTGFIGGVLVVLAVLGG